MPPGTAISTASSMAEMNRGLLRPEMAFNDSSLSLSRQQTPRTLRELGSDYTRYYNPFMSNNNSQTDLASPLTRNGSSTHLMTGQAMSSTDLSKRLSNPFQDAKRMSNPFESAQNSIPGTPMERLHSHENEKQAAATVTGVAAAAAIAEDRAGTPAMIRDADPEKAAFFPFMDDRLGAPAYAFPLYTDAVEDDDDMHMPKWDDDIKLKASWRDRFARENIVSTIGMLLMILGLIMIFIVLPVISYTGTSLIPYSYETPLDQMPGAFKPVDPDSWEYVNGNKYPLLTNLRTGLIDPDTPKSAMTRKDKDGNEMKLVFSDEFNEQNRSFWPGDDPYWYAGNFWYGATQDMEWYDPDAVNTGKSMLNIVLPAFTDMFRRWNTSASTRQVPEPRP